MEIFGCIGLVAIVWLFLSPFISLLLWKRVRELEDRVRELTGQLPSRSSIAVAQENRSRSNVGSATSEHERRQAESTQPDPTISASMAVRSETAMPSTETANQSGLTLIASEKTASELPEGIPQNSIVAASADTCTDHVPEKTVSVTPEIMAANTTIDPVETDQKVPELAAARSNPILSTQVLGILPPVGSSRPNVSLEEILAGKWLAYVGALAVMIGAGFGLKYAIDNQWLGPAGRVVMGVVSGLLCFAGGAYAMRKDYRFLGQSLTGAALGILYSSFYAAFNWYHVLPYEWAFAGMVLTTAGGLTFAHAFDSQPTAFLGMIGGFLTPAMLPPSTDSVWELFPYLLLLDIGVLVVSSVRRWTGLQVLVFFGTIFTWVVWYNRFFKPELLPETLGFLVAFFALFAALGVIHNIVQKRVALAADFFLILATPSVFFAALYWLTYEIWPYEQGYFALVMTAVYASLAVCAARINPIGRSTTAALAGLAGTFLILAPPLSLTGHWVTVAWIAESVLLVELGLRYDLKSLSWTGLSLLAKVQCILIIYGIGTLIDPVDFQTAFVRQRLHLAVPIEQPTLAWTDVFNNRSYSYLVDAFALAILAWEYRRRLNAKLPDDPVGPRQRDLELLLASGVPIVSLLMGLLEIFVWGTLRDWEPAAIMSACAIWTSLTVAPTVAWAVRIGPRGIERVAWTFFGVLTLFLGFDTVWTIDALNTTGQVASNDASSLWMFNARGFGFLFALAAMICAAVVYARDQSRVSDGETKRGDGDPGPLVLDQLFSGMAYWTGLVMVLLETYVWGINHRWFPATILSAFIAWSSAFALGLILWQTDWRFLFRRLTGATTPAVPDRQGFTSADSDIILSAIFSIVGALLVTSAFQTIRSAVGDVSNTWFSSERTWWLINPRGLSFLSACAAGAVSAWLLERASRSNRRPLSLMLGSSTFLTGLTCVLLETLMWGISHDWRPGSILSFSAIWASIFAAGLIAWRVRLGSQSLDKLVVFSFLVLGSFLFLNSLGSIAVAASERSTHELLHDELWLLNPRGASFLVAIAAAALTASLYQWIGRAKSLVDGESTPISEDDRYSTNFFAVTLLAGLVLVLLETNVWGMPRTWLFGSLVSSSAIWTAIFAAGCSFWAVSSRNPLPRQLMIGLFVVLGAMVSLSGIVPFVSDLNESGAAVHGPGYDWWLLNPRGVGFLIAIAATSLAAVLYQSVFSATDPNTDPNSASDGVAIGVSFGVAAFFGGLILVNLETIVWGLTQEWLFGTLVSTSAMWTAIFGAGLAVCVASSRSRELDRLVIAVYTFLGILIFVAGILPFDQSLKLKPIDVDVSALEWWFLNPRGIGYLFGIGATGLAAAMYRSLELESPVKQPAGLMTLSQTLGVSAYLAGLALVTTEAFSQGTTRHWMTGTSLAITIAWTLYATGTIVAGIYWRAATVRILALSLFVLTIGKVFLIDIWHLETVIRVFAFLSLGVALMLISFLYRRFRERIRNWVLPTTSAATGASL